MENHYNNGIFDDYNQSLRIIKINFEGVSQDTWTTVPMQGSGTFSVEAVFQTAIPKQGKVKHFDIFQSMLLSYQRI